MVGNNDTKSKKQFSVTLFKDKEKDHLLVILANVRYLFAPGGEFEVIAEGADRDELLARAVSNKVTGNWNANNNKDENAVDKTYTPFPMWGEVRQRIDDATTQIGTVGMLRGIARVDVVLGTDVIADANFVLNEVYVYNTRFTNG